MTTAQNPLNTLSPANRRAAETQLERLNAEATLVRKVGSEFLVAGATRGFVNAGQLVTFFVYRGQVV